MPEPEGLGHVDLDVVDVLPVPDRLEQAVGESERQDVLRRLLAQEVVDPEDLVLGEDSCTWSLSSSALARSVPNGFSMMIRARSASPASPEGLDHVERRRGRDAQVVEAANRLGVVGQLALAPLHGSTEAVGALGLRDVAQQAGELLPGRLRRSVL